MPRIEYVNPPADSQAASDLKTTFGDNEPFALFKAMASSERTWAKFRGGSLLDGRVLSLRQREIVIDRTCARTGCEWEWGVHVEVYAGKAGLTREEIAQTLRIPPDLSCWAEDEAALIVTVDALHERNTLTDDEFDGLRQHYSQEQIFEIIMLTGHYHTISFLASGLALPLEPTAARFDDYR